MARFLPKEFVEVSRLGGLYTILAYAVMFLVFILELRSFLNPDYATYMSLDEHGSDVLQINFDVDVYDVECRNLKVVVYAHGSKEKVSTWGEDFWLRSIDKNGRSYGMAMKPEDDDKSKEAVLDDVHGRQMKEVRAQDGEKELDADWDSSHDGFKHQSFEHVLQAHDFTFINFFAGWCGHCQNFAPLWLQIAQKVNGVPGNETTAGIARMMFEDRDGQKRTVQMIKMNCVDFREICNAKGVDAYPMLRLYKADGSFSLFEGKRGEIEIFRWLERTVKMKSYGWADNHEAFERGCNAKGRIQIPRVPGHLELTAGSGDQALNIRMTNTSHFVRHLSFSDPDDGRYHRKSWSSFPDDVMKHLSPLDNRAFVTLNYHEEYQHDLKVVSTVGARGEIAYQFSYQGRVSTIPEDAIPQAKFHFDIEPFSISFKRDSKKWYDFGTSLLAMLGGSFVIMRLLSRMTMAGMSVMARNGGGGKSVIARGGLTVGGHYD